MKGSFAIMQEALSLPRDQRPAYLAAAVPLRWGPVAYKLLLETAMMESPAVQPDKDATPNVADETA